MTFNQLDETRLETHVRVLGWLHIAMEIFSIGIGLCIFTFYFGLGLASGEPEAIPILGLIGFFACGMFLIFSIPGLIAGIGLLRRASWSRPLALVVGFFDMMWFPLGTILGLYTFWVLLQDNASEFFDRSKTAATAEAAAIYNSDDDPSTDPGDDPIAAPFDETIDR